MLELTPAPAFCHESSVDPLATTPRELVEKAWLEPRRFPGEMRVSGVNSVNCKLSQLCCAVVSVQRPVKSPGTDAGVNTLAMQIGSRTTSRPAIGRSTGTAPPGATNPTPNYTVRPNFVIGNLTIVV